MTTLVAHPRLIQRPSAFSQTQLTDLARTFDDSEQAVWIHDLFGRCVYRNRAAGQTSPGSRTDAAHDLFDDQDCRIGHLHLRLG
jgi:hypothetical protein